MTSISAITNSINSVEKQQDNTGASPSIFQAIKDAASRTGVDFSYLMKKASQESSFDPSARASSSSATGLFQFTSQTWLSMVKQYGAQYGLGDQAAQISADSTGHLRVADPVARQAILAMRKDPTISAEMAGELDKANSASLKQSVGGKIGGTELYLAHFLGAGGASNFISEMRANPNATAADVLPTAAASNPSVFYNKSGEARTLKQIYQHFAQKFDSNSTTQIANASPITPAAPSTYNVASLTDTTAASSNAAAASIYQSATNPSSNLHTLANSSMTVASASGSTLFTAMVLGQMQGGGLDTTSPLGAMSQYDAKKKNAYAALSAVG